jgi:hypothetical protein
MINEARAKVKDYTGNRINISTDVGGNGNGVKIPKRIEKKYYISVMN